VLVVCDRGEVAASVQVRSSAWLLVGILGGIFSKGRGT